MQAILAISFLCVGIWDADTHDVNNWILEITNYGRFGGLASFWLPESIPFYGAGVWFGATSPQSETLVTVGYGPHGGESEFGPGLANQDPLSQQVRVYMYPDDWPPNPDTFPMAPQMPLTIQESWSCFNDLDSNLHIPDDGRPIGVEVYQTTFADTFVSIEDAIFLKYKIKNCTTHTIENAIFTVVWDVDSPEPAGFFNGLILHKWFYSVSQDSFLVENLGYFYGTTSIYSNDTVAAGIQLIKTPGNIGCAAYKLFTLNLEPNLDCERYLSMAGYNFRTGAYEPYDSLPCGPDDHRILMSCGPFSIPPGGTEEIVIALIAAPYSNGDTMLLAIQARDAKNFYCDSLTAILEEKENSCNNTGMWKLNICPNPFSSITNITVSAMHNAKDTEVRIFNVNGRLVKEFPRLITDHMNRVHITWNGDDNYGHRLPGGVYFFRIMTGDYSTVEKLILIR